MLTNGFTAGAVMTFSQENTYSEYVHLESCTKPAEQPEHDQGVKNSYPCFLP